MGRNADNIERVARRIASLAMKRDAQTKEAMVVKGYGAARYYATLAEDGADQLVTFCLDGKV